METYPNTVLLRNAVGVLNEEREKRKHAGLFVARGSRLRHSVESWAKYRLAATASHTHGCEPHNVFVDVSPLWRKLVLSGQRHRRQLCWLV